VVLGCQFGSSEKLQLDILINFNYRNMAGQARDLEWEKRVQLICQESAIGAQFEGNILRMMYV
jgi:hypothetical protein